MAKLSAFADEVTDDFLQQVKYLAGEGVGYIEPRFVNKKNIMDLILSELKEAKKMIGDHGLKVSAIGSPIGKVKLDEPFEPHLDKFKHAVDLAVFSKTPYIRMFSYYAPEGKDINDYRDEVMDRMAAKVEALADPNVTMVHENEAHIYGHTVAKILGVPIFSRFVENSISYLRFVLAPRVRNIVEDGCTLLQVTRDGLLCLSDKWIPQTTVELCPVGMSIQKFHDIFRPSYTLEASRISKHPGIVKAEDILKPTGLLPPQVASESERRSKLFEFRRYKRVFVEKETYYSLRLPPFLANCFEKIGDFFNLLSVKFRTRFMK